MPNAVRFVSSLDGNIAGFNLASTRVFPIAAAGPRTFYFRLAAVEMDANTSCRVYNAAFSVIFIP